jgi:hypothetical protein
MKKLLFILLLNFISFQNLICADSSKSNKEKVPSTPIVPSNTPEPQEQRVRRRYSKDDLFALNVKNENLEELVRRCVPANILRHASNNNLSKSTELHK